MPAQISAGVVVPKKDANGKPMVDHDGAPIIATKYTGLHALRHFYYVSWCINPKKDSGLEVPPKVVQEPSGHDGDRSLVICSPR
jgi:integrase